MKAITLQDKMNIILSNEMLSDLYYDEISIRDIKWNIKGGYIKGKKVSMQEYYNAQKYAAQFIYDRFNSYIS